MTRFNNKSNVKETESCRVIGKVQGPTKGPTIVFFAGIHGNETAGVVALKKAFQDFVKDDIKGTVFGVLGNLEALEKKQRYIDEDLNRLWTTERMRNLKHKAKLNSEEKEQKNLVSLLHTIIENNSGPFYFIDFHTTSSKTIPFITINDALINRKFSKMFPVPIVLGIEEYLNGPLLSYINQLGYVSLGFESGQHNATEAISNCLSFIYLAMVFSKTISAEKVIGFPVYYNQLKSQSNNVSNIFEIVYLHRIEENEEFKMKEGFESFQDINKNIVLATSNNKPVLSKFNAKLFMPLYQSKGKEGYFIIKKIPPFFLKLSALLRKIKIDNLFILLPGVFWENESKNALVVNLKTARFFAKPIFHLLGYRSKQMDIKYIKLYNRERVSKDTMYKDEIWY